MDGIMFKINRDDGSFMDQGKGSRSVAYFASVTGRDDWILNACPDPDDETMFYIVGATKGSLDKSVARADEDVTVHAVIAKMNLVTLTARWTKQLSVTHASGTDDKPAAAIALGCDVIAKDKLMYVAGVVENGATIDYEMPQSSAGGDDIFVAQLMTDDGTVKWVRQIGSSGDDRVARGGGVIADANGNAVVFGDTNGSLFRDRDEEKDEFSDVFALVLRKEDGRSQDPVVPKAGHTPNNDHSTPNEWYHPSSKRNFADPKTLSFGIIALLLLVLAVVMFLVSRRRSRKQAESQKSSIFTYLQRFDVEDIDLRKSPPGGWHGTYLNKLAYGINKAETNGQLPDVNDPGTGTGAFETAALTHSSVVTDSLFMDTASKPSLGYRDHPGDGLEYHDSYDDLKPRSYEDTAERLNSREVI
jgi:hypothetical protein